MADVRELLLGVTADGEIESGEIRDALKKLGTYIKGHPTPFAKMDATQVFFATMQLLLLSQISEKPDGVNELKQLGTKIDAMSKKLDVVGRKFDKAAGLYGDLIDDIRRGIEETGDAVGGDE